jgi:glycosyltransferase involved in cell wall biosynthesis
MTHLKKDRIFETWLIKHLRNSEPGILHSWNGNSHQLFRELKSRDWLKCVERSCPHNMFQHEIISAEADFLNVEYLVDKASLDRSIEELYLSDIIVAPSKYSASSYSDPELVKKVRVNPLGANLYYRNREKINSGLVILMVGNSFLRKGTHYLIEAFKMIDRADAELWIRGDVPEIYRNRISDKRIKIIPPVLPEKLVDLYKAADVFVQPSIDEGFGMTVLEALSFGLPVVVTENVGAKDMLNSAVSITVPIRNPYALAKAIQQASELPSIAFDEARKKILGNVSWTACAERMFDSVYLR